MNLISKVKSVMFKPDNFFFSVKKEKSFKTQTIFLVSVVFFIFLFLTYNYIQQINRMLELTAQYFGISIIEKIPLTFQTYLIFYLSLVVLYLLLAFLRYWVTHWFVLLFKGKGGYRETYKAMVYTRAPEFFSAPMLLLTTAFLPVAISAGKPLLWLAWGLFLITFLCLSIYQIYLRTKGLAKIQNLSYLESFLSIYILGQITQLVIIFTVEAILLGIFAVVIYIL